jgi:hypothetical protein
MSMTPVMRLELRISPRIFGKSRNVPNGILRGLGETNLIILKVKAYKIVLLKIRFFKQRVSPC